MKRFSKKLTLVLMLLVFAVVALFGVSASFLKSGNLQTTAVAETNSVSEKWFEVNYSSTELQVLLNGSLKDYSGADRGDFDSLLSALAAAIREILANSIFDNNVAAASEMTFDPSDFDWNSTGFLARFKDYVIERLSNPDEFNKFVDGAYDMMIDYAIGNYISSQEGDIEEAYEKINSAFKDVVDQAYENALETAKKDLGEYFNESEWAMKKTQAHKKTDARVESVKANGGNPSISMKQLVAAFEAVSVNGYSLYSAKNGLSLETLRYVLSLIPRPSQIAGMTAAQLRNLVSAHLDVDTTFGKVSFDLTLGLFGDTSKIKSAMRALSEYVDLDVDGANVGLSISMPAAVTDVYAKFLNSSRFTAEQKDIVFSAFSKTANDSFNAATGYSFDDLMNLLKSVDYKNLIANFVNANYINHYFGSEIASVLGHSLTNADIDRLINKVHNFFASKDWDYITVESAMNWLKTNVPGMSKVTSSETVRAAAQRLLSIAKRIDWSKYDADYVREICANSAYKVNETIYSYIDRLGSHENFYAKVVGYTEKLFGMIPDGLKNVSMVDMYDGEKFVNNFDYIVDVQSLTSRIANSLSARGYEKLAKYVDKLPVLLDRDSFHIDLSVELTVPNLHKIEYVAGETVVREGFLPTGVAYELIESLAKIDNIEGFEILYWVDGTTYEQITSMPDCNLTLVPVTEFTVATSEDVEVVYNSNMTYDIGVTVNGVSNSTYTYEWYKDGTALDNSELSLTVSTVADSGAYYVVVTNNATHISVTSDVITVSILPYEINLDLSKLQLKETEFVYTGSKITIELVDNAILNTGFLPMVMNFKTSGDAVTQTNVGEYSLTYSFVLLENDNYVLTGETEKTLTWSIVKATVVVDSSVLELVENAYTYNGKPITVALVDGALEASGYTNSALKLVWHNSNLTQTNAGHYETTLTVTLKDTKNYRLVDGDEEVSMSSKTLPWNIARQSIEISGIQLKEDTFTYDGLIHKVSLVDDCYDKTKLTVSVEGDTEAINAGNYIVEYTFKLIDDKNYEINGESVWSLGWSVDPIHVSLDNVAIREDTFEYTGVQKRILLVSGCYNPVYFEYTVSGTTEATNAGKYQATYKFTLKDSVNYVIDGQYEFTFDWKITPKYVSAPAEWTDTYDYVYGQRVSVAYNGIPTNSRNAYTDVEYTFKKGGEVIDINASDFAWNAGEYTVTVKFALVSTNFAIENSDETSWEWEKNIVITPKNIDLSGATWVAEENATYYIDKEYTVRLNLDGVKNLTTSEKRLVRSMLVYVVNGEIKNEPLTFVNAGTYTISASFSNPNYSAAAIDYEFTIEKRAVKVEVKWSETSEFLATGNVISFYPLNVLVYAEGYKNNPLPSSIAEIVYTGCEASATGSYNAKVNVRLLDTDNFYLEGESEFAKDWTIKEKPVTPPVEGGNYEKGHKFEKDGVTVEIVDGEVPNDYKPSIEKADLDLKAIEDKLRELFGDQVFDIVNAYDIHFEKDGVEKTVNGKFKVSLPIPEEYLNAKKLAVIHIDDEGNITIVNGAERVGDFMEFETDGFSIFAVISLDTLIPWGLIISLIIVGVILIICIILTIILIKKKKDHDKAMENAEAEETKDEPEAVEETNVVAETVEEPVSEETPTEPETVEEEVSAEPEPEPEAEPEVHADPEPEAEPEPEVEPVVEEEVHEEPTVDTQSYEEVVEKPTPVVEVNVEPIAVLPIVDLGYEEVIVLNRSFAARLSQSSEELQAKYTDLKNYALTYRNVRARTSWGCDSINRGRMKVCKLVIKGKTLYAYFAINCETLPEKYHAKPVDGKKYETTPTMLKLKSNRAVKYAKEIIDMIMTDYEVPKKRSHKFVDYKAEYKTDEELLELGLIKKKITRRKSTPWKK